LQLSEVPYKKEWPESYPVFLQGCLPLILQEKSQLGVIEIQQNSSYVGVHADIAEALVEKTNNTRLKKKKVRIKLI
jgi:hypothetical protein